MMKENESEIRKTRRTGASLVSCQIYTGSLVMDYTNHPPDFPAIISAPSALLRAAEPLLALLGW